MDAISENIWQVGEGEEEKAGWKQGGKFFIYVEEDFHIKGLISSS